MIKRSFTIDSTSFNKLRLGSEVLDLNIVSGAKTKPIEKFNLLINSDLLLRIEKKNRTKVRKALFTSITDAKNLVSPKLSGKLKKILSLNNYINGRIALNIQRSYDSQDAFDDFYLLLKKRWDKITELQEDLNLDLIRKDKIGFCKKCHAFRQAGGLIKGGATTRCFICQNPVTTNKTYYSLPEITTQYLSGLWLEDYVAKKLESLGWITTANIYIYGSSEVKFEIDVLATKKGKSLIVECKSGGTGLSSLSSFLAKFYDIKTDLALFVSLTKAGQDMKNMVSRRKNFYLIDHVKSDNDLVRRLKRI